MIPGTVKASLGKCCSNNRQREKHFEYRDIFFAIVSYETLQTKVVSYSVRFVAVFWRLVVRASLADHSGDLLGNSSPSQNISKTSLDLKC